MLRRIILRKEAFRFWGGFLAEIIGEYGGMTGGGSFDAVPEAVLGVPYETWAGWTERDRELFIEDYFRTEQQEYYYRDSWQADAFEYVSFIDDVTDTTKEKWDDITDFGQEKIGDALTILVGLGALYVITR